MLRRGLARPSAKVCALAGRHAVDNVTRCSKRGTERYQNATRFPAGCSARIVIKDAFASGLFCT
jgi:hypothetical protein